MTTETQASREKESFLAAIDYGRVRIGVALAHCQLQIPVPYENYTRGTKEQDTAFFQRLARDEKVSRFIVGLPVHLDGNESPMAAEARKFGQWLAAETSVPVVFFDERFSSVEAAGLLQQRKLTRKKRKQRLDMLAAQVLLAAYLESNHQGEAPAALDDRADQPSQKEASLPKLVFGCGYLGLRVARLWLAQGHKVFAVTRSETRARMLATEGISPIVADVTNPESLTELPRVDTVLFAVGFDRSAGHSIAEVYANGLSNVLDALPEETRKVIYISSTGVYGQTEGEDVDERSPCIPTREGGRAALAAEEVLSESRFRSSGTILRLAGIYGPDRIPHAKTLLAGEAIPTPPAGYLNLIHVDDAAKIVLAAESSTAGGIYCVSDGQPTLRRDYYARLAQLLETAPPRYEDNTQGKAGQNVRGSGSKCIRNDRMLSDLNIELAYPSFREGLAAIVAQQRKSAES